VITNRQEKTCIIETICRIYGIKNMNRFPGCQPVSIERSDLAELHSKDYLVGLKTDGIRYLLLLTLLEGQPCAIMINRAMEMYEVHVWAPYDFFANDCLFDGELVWEAVGDELGLLFLVFDVLRVRENFSHLPFRDRLSKLHRYILPELPAQLTITHERVEQFILDEDKAFIAASHMRMAPKRFVSFEASCVSLWNERYLSCGHKNDGLVFVRDGECVHTGTDRSIFKWKPADNITVDIMLQDKKIVVMRKGQAFVQDDIFIRGTSYSLQLEDNDLMRCLGSVAANTVLECLCVFGEGSILFKPLRTRPDKTTSNELHTVTKTLENLLECILVEELFTVGISANTSAEGPARRSCDEGVASDSVAHVAADAQRVLVDETVAGETTVAEGTTLSIVTQPEREPSGRTGGVCQRTCAEEEQVDSSHEAGNLVQLRDTGRGATDHTERRPQSAVGRRQTRTTTKRRREGTESCVPDAGSSSLQTKSMPSGRKPSRRGVQDPD
jgi:hypothetical protein